MSKNKQSDELEKEQMMDFTGLAKGLAVVSFGLIGVMLVLGPFFPDEVQK